MSEFIVALLGVSILFVSWAVIRLRERVSKLEERLRWIERKNPTDAGRVIDSKQQATESHKTEVLSHPQL